MRQSWWKILCVLLLIYTVIAGFMIQVPALHIVNESIRNLYFHVPMWFVMLTLFGVAAVYSIKYLSSGNIKHDIVATQMTNVGILFSVLGMLTGMIWARFTWGAAWSNDPKQLGTAISMLTYFAYTVLRSGINDEEKRARISAVYNIFAYALLFPLIYILPRMVDSLHPGNGGNPAFGKYDLDNNMRLVFYPAIIGWVLLGLWIASLKIRLAYIKHNKEMKTLFDSK